MGFLHLFRELFFRVAARKKTLVCFGVLFLCGFILGIAFIKTPAIYGYHLRLCDRFVDRVCYSDRSIFVIFVERSFANGLFLILILCSGVHPIGLILPPMLLCYRSYTFGGSIVVFFSVYRMSGALIVFVLYLPIHLLIDLVLIGAAAISCERAFGFQFCQRDFIRLGRDALLLVVCVAVICLLEAVLLLVLFHPIGNLL